MEPVLLAAILSFAARYGIPALLEFFRNRGTTIDEAIAALEKAQAKSLEDYIDEDAAQRFKKFTSNPPPPLA